MAAEPDDAANPRPNGFETPVPELGPIEQAAPPDGAGPGVGDAALPVVGLGGSAGSIQALQAFFSRTPADTGLAYVVVLHLAPEHPSTLPELLQRHAAMPVRAAADGDRLEADRVYVIPPGKHLVVTDGHLGLTDLRHEHGKRVAVDLFFRSLADTHGPHAISIVLSGADGDGALGLKRVKERGGLTIAQDPEEAEHPSMPSSAIATGMVDWILCSADMPARIVDYFASERRLRLPPEEGPRPARPADLPPDQTERLLREVLAFLRTRTGRDFTYYRRATIVRRISRRMQVSGAADLAEYLSHLRIHPGEASALLQDLLISVTNFFRDRKAFAAVEAQIPALFRDKRPGASVRVWCAACATGEEAYSMAMLLLEHARTLDSPPTLQVFGCDLDEAAIQVARAGFYPDSIAADVSDERLRRFFVKEPGGWRVRREMREIVLFASHDLLKDAPFSRMDLVSCRNLLIYLNHDAQARALQILNFALKPGGLLFLGSSESVEEDSELFQAVDKPHRLYRQRPTHPVGLPVPVGAADGALQRALRQHDRLKRTVVTLPSGAFLQAEATPPGAPSGGTDPGDGLAADVLHFRLLGRHGPASLVVNAEHDIVHLSENAHRYLHMPEGVPTKNLPRLVHPSLRIELRAALLRAQESGEAVDVLGRPVDLPEGRAAIDIRVAPGDDVARGAMLVLFEARPTDVPGAAGDAAATGGAALEATAVVRQLERELARAQVALRETIEQAEAAAEEWKAGNEELQAMNEELRSAGEELETGREELQSVNEELTTVNAEFRSRVDELARANSDLHNLMGATQIATVFLGRDLQVMRYTPSAAPLFNLIASDIGRPIGHLNRRLDYPDLAADADAVVRTLVPIERELRDDGHWYLARVLPYRTLDDHVGGVVLTFVDITERRRAEEALRRSEELQTFLLGLSDALRSAEEPLAIQQLATKALGEHLRATRAYYFHVEQDDGGGRVHVIDTDWRRDDRIPSHAGRHALRSFGDALFEGFESGRTVAVDDVAEVSTLAPAARERYRSIDVAAFLNVPLIENGSFVVGIGVHDAAPRAWDAAEIALVREVASRAWVAVERARAERALRDREAWLAGQKEAFQHAVDGAPLETSLGRLVESAVAQAGAGAGARGAFYIADGDTERLRHVAGTEVPQGERVGGFAADADQRSWTFPIETREGQIVGAFVLHFPAPRTPAPQDHAFAALVTRAAAIIISRSQEAEQRGLAQIALRASEEKYRVLFDSMDEGYCILEMLYDASETARDWRFLQVNRAFADNSGLRDAEGRTIRELVPGIEPRWFEIYDQVAKRGEPLRFEETSAALGRTLSLYAFRIGGPDERKVAVIFTDITERVRAEVALAGSETRLRLAIEAADLGTWEWTLATDEVLWNKRHFTLFGMKTHENPVHPDAFFRHVHPDDRQRIETDLRNAIRFEDLFASEFRAVLDTGQVRWMSGYGRVVEEDADGKASKVAGVMADITERKAAEQALRASETLSRAIAENLPGGAAFVVDRNLRYLLAGGEALAGDGPGPGAFTGRSIAEVVGTAQAAAHEAHYRGALAGHPFMIEHETRGRHFLTRGVPLRDAQGSVEAALAVSYDITDRKRAEDAVRRSEERLRTLADAVPQLIWANDGAGHANYFNRRWHDYTGLSFEASQGPGWQAIVHPTDGRDAKRAWRRALAAGAVFDHEYRLRGGDGGYRWFIGRNVPVHDDAGRVSGWFGTATDIDGLKLADAALRSSEEQFRRAVEDAPVPVIMQAEDGQVLQISRTWTTLTGYGPEDVATFEAWLSRVHGESALALHAHVQQLFRGERGQLETEFDITTHTGDQRRWSFSASAPGMLRDGRRFIVGMAVDITQRRQAEAALRESRERLQLIVENAREYAIVSMDVDRRITSWNAGAEGIIGYTQEEAVGRYADMIFTPEDRSAGVPEREAATALAEGRAADERWHIRRNGSRFWGSGMMTAMHDASGSAIGLVKIFRDQTRELHAKEALEQSRSELRTSLRETEVARDQAEAAGKAKDRFLAILSHELRTPLTPLLLGVEMLARHQSLPPGLQRAVEIIERNARLETHLVDDLLDVTRITTGKMELALAATALHEIVTLAVEVSAPDVEAKEQKLTIALAPGDDALRGDVKRLQQVFWNLLKNASKFTPRGGGIGIVSSLRGDRAIVQVQDTGVGFEPEAAERIFEAFEQGGERVTRQYGGLGLGLAIARASVEAHGGSIRAESEGPGRGATFIVELPLAGRG